MNTSFYDEIEEHGSLGYDSRPYRIIDDSPQDFPQLVEEVRDSLSRYLHRRPLIATSFVFLAGFYLGWKVKPW